MVNLDTIMFGNSGRDYLVAFAIFAGAYLLLYLFKFIIIKRLEALARRTKTDIDDLLIEMFARIKWPFYMIISTYIAARSLTAHPFVNKALQYLLLIGVIFYAVRAIQGIIGYITKKAIIRKQEADKEYDSTAIELLSKITQGVLWVFAIIMLLSNLGYNVSALLAGVGIGGIAIAFALQNILSDIFSSFSIYFDKPFKKGDFIIIGPDMGVVERVGIKSTRIQSLEGQELVVPNKELTNIRINNYKRMKKRRIAFTIGVAYETSNAKLKKIPGIIGKIITAQEKVAMDRVHFKKFGDSSLLFEIVYFLDSSDYKIHMDTQHNINLSIKQAFEKEKIEFAYPTQKVFVSR